MKRTKKTAADMDVYQKNRLSQQLQNIRCNFGFERCEWLLPLVKQNDKTAKPDVGNGIWLCGFLFAGIGQFGG